jgi:spore coat protein CotF
VASHVFLWSGPEGGQISIGFDDAHFGLPQMRAEINFMRAAHPKLPDEVPRGTSFAFTKEESTGYLLAHYRVGNNVYRNADQNNLSHLWESAHYVARLMHPTDYERAASRVSRSEA